MQALEIGSKNISIFLSTKPRTPIIYLNTFSDEGRKVYEAAQATGCPPFTLVAISDLDWNHDMVPWDSPPSFKNAEPCTGGADDYLRLLTEEIIPTAEKELAGVPSWRGIAGYSLAGLFAVYSIYQTDVFSRTASISGSLWFPGIKEYIVSHMPQKKPACMYFSLGDRECHTRNKFLKCVQQNTEALESFYRQQGIDTIFRLNPGNHFRDGVLRTAAGLQWILEQRT